MLGAGALLLLYLVLIGRGLRVAIERDDAFGKLLATGLTTIVAVQTFVDRGGRDPADPADRASPCRSCRTGVRAWSPTS